MADPLTTQMQTTNMVDELRQWVQPLIKRLSAFPEVEGVVLLAGVARQPYRPFADIYSDVDLALFLNTPLIPDGVDLKDFTLAHQEQLPEWLPDYQFLVPLLPQGEREINLHQLLYSYESRADNEWPEAKKEAYAYTSDVVYDCQGRVRRLIKSKTRFDAEARTRRLARLAVQLPWCGWLNPHRQLKRGLATSAQDLLNEAVELIVEALFLINSRYRPHRKWRSLAIENLAWKPAGFIHLLKEAMLVFSFEKPDVERRITAIQTLWPPLLERALAEEMIPPDYEQYLATHISLNRQLRVETLADKIIAAARELKAPMPDEHLRAFINLLVPESPEQFLHYLNDPSFNCPEFFQSEFTTLKSLYTPLSCALNAGRHS
jgi:hypothetical protein